MGEDAQRLARLFKRKRVMDLPTIQAVLEGRSRRSLFRDLAVLGYQSSYTHAGRYYTLHDFPQFDTWGIWFHDDVGFSQGGTLKVTLVQLMNDAEAGYTHRELEMLLRVRLHNTLLGLVSEHRIGRQRIDKMYLYVSTNNERRSTQVGKRQAMLQEAKVLQPLAPALVIEVLVEVVQRAAVTVGPALVAKRLASRGVGVNTQQVEQVYRDYGLETGKKKLVSQRSQR